MLVTKVSALTGATHQREIDVTQHQLIRHADGELIQDVCPHLNAVDREFLITGITPAEWNQQLGCVGCDD